MSADPRQNDGYWDDEILEAEKNERSGYSYKYKTKAWIKTEGEYSFGFTGFSPSLSALNAASAAYFTASPHLFDSMESGKYISSLKFVGWKQSPTALKLDGYLTGVIYVLSYVSQTTATYEAKYLAAGISLAPLELLTSNASLLFDKLQVTFLALVKKFDKAAMKEIVKATSLITAIYDLPAVLEGSTLGGTQAPYFEVLIPNKDVLGWMDSELQKVTTPSK